MQCVIILREKGGWGQCDKDYGRGKSFADMTTVYLLVFLSFFLSCFEHEPELSLHLKPFRLAVLNMPRVCQIDFSILRSTLNIELLKGKH